MDFSALETTTPPPTSSAPSSGGSLDFSALGGSASAKTPVASSSAPAGSKIDPVSQAGAAFALKSISGLSDSLSTGISSAPYSDPKAESDYLTAQAPILTAGGKALQDQSDSIVSLKSTVDKQGATYDSLEKDLDAKKADLDASEKDFQSYQNYGMATQDMVDDHNAKVDAYNKSLATLQNFAGTYKSNLDNYNSQVDDYTSKSQFYNTNVNNFNARIKPFAGSAPVSPLDQFKGQTISEANSADKVPESWGTKIINAIVPSFIQKEFGIYPSNSIQESIQLHGDAVSLEQAIKNPEKIDPTVYFNKGLTFGNNLNGDNVVYDKDFPQPTTTAQKIAYTIGNIATMAIAQPLIGAAISGLAEKVPALSKIATSIETYSKTSTLAKTLVPYAQAITKAGITGGLFGLITKNKQTVAQNVVDTAGMFAGFEALAYPIIAFFRPVMTSVATMDFQNNELRNILNDPSVTQPNVTKTLWFKNPNDENQFIKVTANGVEFQSGTDGIVKSGTNLSDVPTITSGQIEVFRKDPSLYENLKSWVKNKISPDIKNVDFRAIPPDEATLQTHIDNAKESVANPEPEQPVVIDHPLRGAKAEMAQDIPQAENIIPRNDTEVDQTLYHGTSESFDNFDVGKSKSGAYTGVHLAETPEAAMAHGNIVKSPTIKGNFYDVGDSSQEAILLKNFGGPDAQESVLQQKIVAAGYDGIKRGTEYISFGHDIPNKGLQKSQNSPEINTEGGFANVGAIAESVKNAAVKTKEYIEHTNKDITVSKNLDDTLYKGQKNAEADTIQNHQLLEHTTENVSLEERANILAYRDSLEAGLQPPKLSEKEQAVNDHIIEPLYKDSASKVSYIKKAGVPFSSENYSHRIAKNKGGLLDKVVSQKNKLSPKGGTGSSKNILRKSAPALKHREFFNATDENGKRTVVHISQGRVTAFENKKPRDLGKFETKSRENLMKEEIAPLQEKLKKIQSKIDGLKLIKVKDPVSLQRMADLKNDIAQLVDYIDSNVGAFTQDELKEEVRKLRVWEKERQVLKSVKTAEQVTNAEARLASLQSDMVELSNKIAGIEAKYNPNELSGRVFTSEKQDDYKKYTISQATTAEIEAHSNVEYYHDPITAAIFSHEDITRAYNAVKLLETLKSDPLFIERTFKAGEGLPPEGWKTVNLDQFRGYYFEPHTANTLNAFAQDLKSGDDPVKVLTWINNVMVNTMFLSPVKHLLNVGTSAVINRGATRWLNPLAYPVLARTTIEAVRSVVAQDEDYIKILRSGAPMMAAKADQDKYRENILSSLGEKKDPYSDITKKIIKIGGKITPFHWAHALTWPGNDMILQQQIREELAKKGLTIKSATNEQIEAVVTNVTKVLPSYRTPVTLRRIPKYVTRNTILFASYRYNLIKSFFELGKSVIMGDSEEAGSSETYDRFGKSAWKARGNAINKILVMAFLSALAMPYIDEKIKQWTGNNNAYLSDPGQLSVIDNANKLINDQINLSQYLQTMVDLAPGTKEALQQLVNLDFFTGKNIQTQGTPTLSLQDIEERGTHAEGTVTPFDLLQKISGGTESIGQLFVAQLGIQTPKGNNLVNILQGSNASVLTEIDRLNKTATPPSSSNIESRPDVQIFKTQVTPAKYQEAISQFTGTFVSNVAKLMDDEYVKSATGSSIAKKLDYTDATDEEKSKMIDTVKDETMKTIEKAYDFNKGTGISGKAVFEGEATKGGIPTIENLSRPAADDGTVKEKNSNGDPIYQRFSLSDSEAIANKLYNSDPYWKDNGYSRSDLALDHIVPVSAGGTNTINNLELISNLSNQLNSGFELYMVEKYKAGTISRADVIKASVDYKINKSVSLTDIKNGKY